MKHNFDNWNILKKKIDGTHEEPNKYPKEGEVWMSNVGKNIGFEQNGAGETFSRPILIVKKFNNRMFWGIPLSTKQKALDFYFNYTDPNGNKVSAILAQIRLLSVKRLYRKMYEQDADFLNDIKAKLRAYLE